MIYDKNELLDEGEFAERADALAHAQKLAKKMGNQEHPPLSAISIRDADGNVVAEVPIIRQHS